MNLPDINTIPDQKTVLIRLDLDLPFDSGQILDNSRLKKSLPTLFQLLGKNCKLIVIGHLGRPGGKPDPALSLRPIYIELLSLLNSFQEANHSFSSVFLPSSDDKDELARALIANDLVMLENLRFHPGEELNSPDFAADLARHASYFVNDSFANSHRHHASVSALKDLLPTFYGEDFQKEFQAITEAKQNPVRPLTLILAGGKKSKLDYLPQLMSFADNILIAGLLPKYYSDPPNPKILVAKLQEDEQDIDLPSREAFVSVIEKSSTIFWAGPIGNYISPSGQEGNKAIALAVTSSPAYTLIGGGDTEAVISSLNLKNKVGFISHAGGALLHLLSYDTLPAIKT